MADHACDGAPVTCGSCAGCRRNWLAGGRSYREILSDVYAAGRRRCDRLAAAAGRQADPRMPALAIANDDEAGVGVVIARSWNPTCI